MTLQDHGLVYQALRYVSLNVYVYQIAHVIVSFQVPPSCHSFIRALFIACLVHLDYDKEKVRITVCLNSFVLFVSFFSSSF